MSSTAKNLFAALATSWVFSVALSSGAAAQASNGSGYSPFNPTPDRLLREFGTDRPDVTEGPFTVDPGRVQLETDIFNYTKSRPDQDGTVTEKFLFGATTFRIGLTKKVELGFVVQPYNAVRTRTTEPATSWKAGVDVLQLRPKINLWGNDTYKQPGATALGLIPFVNIPTARNGVGPEHVEGGFAIPFAVKLTDKVDFTAMTQLEYRKNQERSGHHFEYVNSAIVSYQMSETWTTYAELVTRYGNESPFGGMVIVGGGLLYKLSPDLQLDFGVNVGLTRASDRINPFIGISRRF